MNHYQAKLQTVLLVDDEPANLQVLRQTLGKDYRLLFAKDGATALDLVEKDRPDLILLDIMMPGISGYDVCKTLKSAHATHTIPIIFVTALAEENDEQLGLEMGAVDYISKPFNPHIVRARVRTHLSLVRADEVFETRLKIIQCLGAAAEYKDNETGLHVIRMSHICKVIALACGQTEYDATQLMLAAPMHDVGKIGIPDAILQKPGKLDADERAIMNTHAAIGAQIIGEHTHGLLKMAASIAQNHHEKWDGTGYPNGLCGTQIPLEARIVALADVFDALTSVRPYKQAWTVEAALELIQNESGKHFDPDLVEVFMRCTDEIVSIQQRWAETQ